MSLLLFQIILEHVEGARVKSQHAAFASIQDKVLWPPSCGSRRDSGSLQGRQGLHDVWELPWRRADLKCFGL